MEQHDWTMDLDSLTGQKVTIVSYLTVVQGRLTIEKDGEGEPFYVVQNKESSAMFGPKQVKDVDADINEITLLEA